jgi:signal transduction histidine kinase
VTIHRAELKSGQAPELTVSELRALAARYQKQLENERTRLARELHDDLTQKLTVVSLELSLVDNSVHADEERGRARLRENIKELSQLVADMINSLRRIKGELRPKVLDEYGLIAAVEWESNEFARKTGIRCAVRAEPEEIAMTAGTATELFRIFQEIMTNVEKHAHAKRVEVLIRQEGQKVILRVGDDGIGISTEALKRASSVGLLELRERAATLQGQISVVGTEGRGTTVTVEAPLSPARRAAALSRIPC